MGWRREGGGRRVASCKKVIQNVMWVHRFTPPARGVIILFRRTFHKVFELESPRPAFALFSLPLHPLLSVCGLSCRISFLLVVTLRV